MESNSGKSPYISMRRLNNGEAGEAPQIKNRHDVMIRLKGFCDTLFLSSLNRLQAGRVSVIFGRLFNSPKAHAVRNGKPMASKMTANLMAPEM